MAKRSSYGQRKHDSKVRQLATSLKRCGWKVNVDIKGFDQPKPIGNKIPDITAQKGSGKKIIEVETPDSLVKDKEQHTTFRRSAAQQKGTSFEIKETN